MELILSTEHLLICGVNNLPMYFYIQTEYNIIAGEETETET